MELKPVYLFVVAFIVIVMGVVTLQQSASDMKQIDLADASSSQSILQANGSSTTLSPIGNGITSFTSAIVSNRTHITCDGVNDVLTIPSSSTTSLSFWYNSSTSTTWQFVANVSGVNFTNGSAGNPVEYPVYYASGNYYLCKTGASAFWAGSIDQIRIYNNSLSTTEITALYNNGRVQNVTPLANSGTVATTQTVLQNNGSSTALSQTSNGWNNATVKNMTWLNFDGTNDNVDLPNIAGSPTSFTISIWVNKNNDITQQYVITDGDNMQYPQFINNQTIVYMWNNSGAKFYVNGTNLSMGVWHNIIVTQNATNANLSLYEDGVYINSTNVTTARGLVRTDLGRATTNTLNGSIDEFRLYNRTLEASEILQIYNSGRQTNQSLTSDGLIIWQSFNEDIGTTTNDKANVSMNGIIGSGATWQNDGVNNLLTENTDYTQNTTLFTTINGNYAWSNITLNYISGAGNTNQKVYLPLNENTGTTAYNFSTSTPTALTSAISGASWGTDGNNVTLSSGTDYIQSGSSFKTINDLYSWNQIVANWGYSYNENGSDYQVATLIQVGIALSILAFVILIINYYRKDFY